MVRTVVIILFLTKELYSLLLLYFSASAASRPVPPQVKDVYSDERYALYRAYKKDNLKTAVCEAAVETAINIIFLTCNVYASVFNAFCGMNIYLRYFLVMLAFDVISLVISLPFAYYDTFVIEERYGMNKTTKKTFLSDRVKSFFISLLLSTILLFAVTFFFSRFGIAAIIWTVAAVVIVSLVANILAVPLMRIFNRFTPLEEGELKAKLLSLCSRYGVKVKRIVVRDASRRTTKANAFCSGLGRKTISIDDNLMNGFTTDEIVAVFAHEFAHAKYRHVLKSLPFALIRSTLLIAALGVLLEFPAFFTAFGFTETNYFFAFLLIDTVIWPLSVIFETFSNTLSRKHEYEADAFAAKEGYGESLIDALRRLVNEALGEINPHPWIVMTQYSHPTLAQRIDSIRKNENKQKPM